MKKFFEKMKGLKNIRKKRVKKKINLLLKNDKINEAVKIKRKRKKAFDIFSKNFCIKILFPIFIVLLFLYFLLIKKKKYKFKNINNYLAFNYTNKSNYINNSNNTSFEYYACLTGTASKENKYAKELVEYYIKLGVDKFIFGDNNLPNTEKLSDVLQDYISNGIVDIIEIFGSTIGQSEFGQSIYEKYKTRCKWFLFFDFDEYLEIFFNKNETLTLKQFLSNQIFSKCESISFNWLIYTDNELIFYDNRPLLERFTTPYYEDKDNEYVKSIVRGNLDKIIFYPKTYIHFPSKNLSICDSKGKLIYPKGYDSCSISPPIYDYGYLKHFTTKTAEEYCVKIKRGTNEGKKYNINERVDLFFYHNKFTEEKLKVFENTFNMSFNIPNKK